MQNLPLTEDGLIRALRDVETPAAPRDLVSRLGSRSQRSHRWAWTAIPATAVVTAGLVVFLSLPSEMSLAQVASALDSHNKYTITNTRVLGQGRTMKIVFYRDGKMWRTGETFGLPDRTVSIAHHPPRTNFVVTDDRREPPPNEFRLDRMLRAGATASIEYNVNWNGRKVTRFKIHTTYRDGRIQSFDQTLIADPKTKLPIQMTIMRDGASWGDIWDYQFEAPAESVFQPSIPKDASMYDLREQRRDLASKLSSGPVGGILIDEMRSIWILTDESIAGNNPVTGDFDGVSIKLSGRLATTIDLGQKPHEGMPSTLGSLSIGGHEWHVVMLQIDAEHRDGLDPIWNGKQVGGSISIGSKKIDFASEPIIRTAVNLDLLRNFLVKSPRG